MHNLILLNIEKKPRKIIEPIDRKTFVKTKKLKKCPKPKKIVKFSGLRMMKTAYPNCFKIVTEPGKTKPLKQSKTLRKYKIIFIFKLLTNHNIERKAKTWDIETQTQFIGSQGLTKIRKLK